MIEAKMKASVQKEVSAVKNNSGFFSIIKKDFIKNYGIYLMLLPLVIYYIVFCYLPMYGVIISFKDFVPNKGILGSPWVAFKHFSDFFNGVYFWRTLRNTLLINVYQLAFGFTSPILLALLLNELKNKFFKRTVQTITYFPHFISVVVIAGMISDFTASDGIINSLIAFMGFERFSLLSKPELFRSIYVISDVWQGTGWGSIIYIAALTAIDQELYKAAEGDGNS